MPDVPALAGVLLIEDNAGIRKMLEAFLTQRAFPYWSAASGREGLALLNEHRDKIGVVLCDVQMPDWDGPKTLEEIRRVEPTVPFVFITGASGGYAMNDLLAIGAARVFKKPFESLSLLGDTLRQLIDQKP